MVFDQLTRIEANMLTRTEWTAHQQRFDGALADMHRRIDDVQARSATQTSEWRAESMAAHKEYDARLDAMQKERREDEKVKEKEASSRRFTLALSILGGALSIITGITVFIIQGVVGG